MGREGYTEMIDLHRRTPATIHAQPIMPNVCLFCVRVVFGCCQNLLTTAALTYFMVWWSGLLNLNNHSTRDAESSSADPARASQEPRLADVVSLIAGMHSRAPKTQGKMTGMHRRSLRARRASRCSKRLRASRNVWGEIAGACDLCRRNAVSALSEFCVPDVSLSIIPHHP